MFSAEDLYVRSFFMSPLISLGLTGVFRVYNRYYNRDKKENYYNRPNQDISSFCFLLKIELFTYKWDVGQDFPEELVCLQFSQKIQH